MKENTPFFSVNKKYSSDIPSRRIVFEDCLATEKYLTYESIFKTLENSDNRYQKPNEEKKANETLISIDLSSVVVNHSPIYLTPSVIFETPQSSCSPLASKFKCSSPIFLDQFEDHCENNLTTLDEIPEDFEVATFNFLFEGSDVTHENFHAEFNQLVEVQKISDAAKKDCLKLFAKNLPQPNSIFDDLPVEQLPLTTCLTHKNSKFILIDILDQLSLICKRNSRYIKVSGESGCTWESDVDCYIRGEIQLVLNVDGVPVFKSRKMSVWPIWVQVFNLPPRLRSAFSNMSLLGLWHGVTKPDFDYFLPSLQIEIESLCKRNVNIPYLGYVRFKLRSIVCDMPAKANMLCMNQFIGYNSCPHCFILGKYAYHKMIFSVAKSFIHRETKSFKLCGTKAKKQKEIVYGIKSYTPMNYLIDLPWNCPIDPMHQVFLGTGKTLTKMLISFVKGNFVTLLDDLILSCKVPQDILHRPKRVGEVQFWKAMISNYFCFT